MSENIQKPFYIQVFFIDGSAEIFRFKTQKELHQFESSIDDGICDEDYLYSFSYENILYTIALSHIMRYISNNPTYLDS